MSKESGVILLGIFIATLPFLGFPQALRDDFFIIAGLGLILLGIFLRADHLKRQARDVSIPKNTPSQYGFVENGPSNAVGASATRKISDITPSE